MLTTKTHTIHVLFIMNSGRLGFKYKDIWCYIVLVRLTYYRMNCFSVEVTFSLYSGTPLKGHPLNEDTSLIRTVDQVPTSYKYEIVLFAPWNEVTPLIRSHFRGPRVSVLEGSHYTWIKLTHPRSNSTQVFLQPSTTCSLLKPHPHINKLAIVMALSWQPLAQTGINASLPEMGTVQGKRTIFSTHLCIGGQQWPTQSQPRHFQSRAQKRPFCLHPLGAPTHLPSVLPFLLSQNLSPKVFAGSDVTRWKFHAGYIWERVKPKLRVSSNPLWNFRSEQRHSFIAHLP